MKQKVLYMILAACLLLTNASDGLAKSRKKVEDPEISKLKGKIENVMQKVDAQPDWLYSRLQMFWKTHASDVFVNGETFAKIGGERAPEPTVKYNGTRGMESHTTVPVYAAAGDMRYGKMAAKVFDVYMKGIAYRNVPIDLNRVPSIIS